MHFQMIILKRQLRLLAVLHFKINKVKINPLICRQAAKERIYFFDCMLGEILFGQKGNLNL